jgi:hypothetical protein
LTKGEQAELNRAFFIGIALWGKFKIFLENWIFFQTPCWSLVGIVG